MKKLILILSLFFQLYSYSQKYEIYLPMRTYHFSRNEATMEDYINTEGGDLGFIIKRTNKHHQQTAGVFRNSYGDTSYMISYGLNYKVIRNIESSLNLGLATGYEDFYKYADISTNFPKILKSNNIIPTTMLTLTYTKFKIKPTIVVSPIFINIGLTLNLK